MAIKYALYPNHLTSDPEDHLAVVQDQNNRSIEDIIEVMIRSGSTVTKAEALSVIEEYEAAIVQLLSDGDSVNTPLMRITASIPGVFSDKFDNFDPARHYVRLNVNPGARVSDIIEDLEVEKVEASRPKPVPQVFLDIASDTTDESLTPGGAGELKGSRLKIDPAETDQGVFFIAADGTETRADTYIRNKPANLICMIPDGLASGEYKIVVRTMFRDTNDLRAGRLGSEVVVP